MKSFLLFLVVLGISITDLFAQSKLSIAPTYWFDYKLYSYQADLNFNGSNSRFDISERNRISSLGLSAHYQFTPKWDLSVGAFYYREKTNLIVFSAPPGDRIPFTNKGWQVPILVNYQLTKGRLSPYFSVGALLTKNTRLSSTPLKTNGLVGIGLNYRFNSAWSLLLQPTASYSFNKPTSNDVIHFTNYISYNLGVQTQLIWHF